MRKSVSCPVQPFTRFTACCGTAFLYAVEWGIILKSPVPLDGPKQSTQERGIWTEDEMRAALASMDDPILHLAVHLTLVGALWEGEVAGLMPEDIDFNAADGIGTFSVNKTMQRVKKQALELINNADPATKAQLRLALMT